MDQETSLQKSIGQALRESRTKRHFTLDEMARRTRVHSRYLEAMEADRWNDIPSEAHRQGFLRLYAASLGLAADALAVEYQKLRRAAAPNSLTLERRSAPRQGKPSHSWLWPRGVLVLLLVGVLGWIVTPFVVRRWSPYLSLPIRRFQPLRSRLPLARERVPHQLTVTTHGATWIRVWQGRRVLFEGRLPPGVTREWNVREAVTLRVADQQAVQVMWDGVAADLPRQESLRSAIRTFPFSTQAGELD